RVVLDGVDLSFYRRADHRTAHDAIADRQLSGKAREVGTHFGKLDAALRLTGRTGNNPVKRRFTAHDEIADRERTDLRPLLLRRRIHGDRHLPAKHARIQVGEPKQGAGVFGFEKKDLMVVGWTQTQFAVERRIAPDLGFHREITDLAATAR